jgi:hypothetical protein
MSNDFDVGPADRALVHVEHPLRGLVGQLQPALLVDDEHAFDHPRQDRLHARTIPR